MDTAKPAGPEERTVAIHADYVTLEGNLVIPGNAKSIVLFVHGSGSSRHSPRNKLVAQVLHNNGIATLLFDLLTLEEEARDSVTGHLRFDIGLLTRRLIGVTDWVTRQKETKSLKLGYFGASTGAAAALVAAVERPDVVKAVVSRGGRPDLADEALPHVKAPTLLIVGGNDYTVITVNREALSRLVAEKDIVIIPGATHLFEEPGTLEAAAHFAADWFLTHLDKT